MRSSTCRAHGVLPLALAILLSASVAEAQDRGRIVITPAVEILLPGSYYAREHRGPMFRNDVDIRQEPLALVGGQLSYELPGTSWRLGIGYARGESDLKVHWYYRQGAERSPSGQPSSFTSFERRFAEPATRELVTLAAARELVRGPASVDLGTALVHQRLEAIVYRGILTSERVERSYAAWGLQVGSSAGPARGWARGLRVGARAQVLRTPPELYDTIRFLSESEDEADLEVGLVASLGWRLTF